MSAKRSWTGRAAAAAMAVGLALATSAAIAAPAVEQVDSVIVPSAKSLMRFYPTQLSSTPSGTVEDQDVWLAKVQGLMAGAPSLLQQSLLMSQTKQEFSANVALLQQMQKGMLEQGALDLRTQVKSGQLTARALGDVNNLVYKSLEPCRIMDTRNASGASGVQGPLVGNHLYSIPDFITAGSNWSAYGQTGTLSDCGLTNGVVSGNTLAVALIVTILNPNFDAFLGMSDVNNLNTTLSHVALNYTHGQGLSTLYILTQNFFTIYFAMPAGLSANLIFDVVGYFITADATALDCTHDQASGTVSIPSAGIASAFSAGCAAGRTLAGGGCYSPASSGETNALWIHNSTFQYAGANAWFCRGFNNTGGAITMNVDQICCRTPGFH